MLDNKKIYDISPLISPNIAVWPGDIGFKRMLGLSFEKGENIELSSMQTTVHLGAHADAPSHYVESGIGIDCVELSHYLGLCQVIHVSGEPLVSINSVREKINEGIERVLIKTDSYPDPNKFNEDFAAFDSATINFLADFGVKLIGIDTPSMDPFSSKELPSHKALTQNNISNLEGLVLRDIEEGLYTLIALPLKLRNFDASPVRAVLLDLK